MSEEEAVALEASALRSGYHHGVPQPANNDKLLVNAGLATFSMHPHTEKSPHSPTWGSDLSLGPLGPCPHFPWLLRDSKPSHHLPHLGHCQHVSFQVYVPEPRHCTLCPSCTVPTCICAFPWCTPSHHPSTSPSNSPGRELSIGLGHPTPTIPRRIFILMC